MGSVGEDRCTGDLGMGFEHRFVRRRSVPTEREAAEELFGRGVVRVGHHLHGCVRVLGLVHEPKIRAFSVYRHRDPARSVEGVLHAGTKSGIVRSRSRRRACRHARDVLRHVFTDLVVDAGRGGVNDGWARRAY